MKKLSKYWYLYKKIKSQKSKRKKLALFGEDLKFLDDIYSHLKKRFDIVIYERRKMPYRGMNVLLRWADLAWFEWSDQILIRASHLSKHCPIIARLHSFEALTSLPEKINWSNIDALIFVAKHVQKIAQKRFPSMKRTPSYIIPNAINLEKFKFYPKKKGYHLAFVANISHKKGIPLLIQCFYELLKIDPRYKLHLAGEAQEIRFDFYLSQMIEKLNLKNKIIRYGRINNIPKFLSDKHFIISTSPFEGCPLNILEGMACGLKPIVHSWIGAEEIFPQEFIFKTTDEFVNLVTENNYKPEEYRKFIEKKFALSNQLKMIDRIINKVLNS